MRLKRVHFSRTCQPFQWTMDHAPPIPKDCVGLHRSQCFHPYLAVGLEDDVGVHPPGRRGLPQSPTALAYEGQFSGREESALREQLAGRLPVQDQLDLPLLQQQRRRWRRWRRWRGAGARHRSICRGRGRRGGGSTQCHRGRRSSTLYSVPFMYASNAWYFGTSRLESKRHRL